jgi:hypothetical protein
MTDVVKSRPKILVLIALSVDVMAVIQPYALGFRRDASSQLSFGLDMRPVPTDGPRRFPFEDPTCRSPISSSIRLS